MDCFKYYLEIAYYIAFIILTGLITYYAARTYSLESSRKYELLCDLIIHDTTTAGFYVGYALEVYNAGNKVAKNVSVSVEGNSLTIIDFVKPNSSYVFPVGKLLQTLGGARASEDSMILVEQGKPFTVTLSVDNQDLIYHVNSDLLYATQIINTGSIGGIEDRLRGIEREMSALGRR